MRGLMLGFYSTLGARVKGFVVASLALLTFATVSHAAVINGSMAVIPDPFIASTASDSSTSLTLTSTHLITSLSGDFAATIPVHSDLTASTATISGLLYRRAAGGSHQHNYFVFLSSPDL